MKDNLKTEINKRLHDENYENNISGHVFKRVYRRKLYWSVGYAAAILLVSVSSFLVYQNDQNNADSILANSFDNFYSVMSGSELPLLADGYAALDD